MSAKSKFEDMPFGHEQAKLDFQRPPVEDENARVWRLEARLRGPLADGERERVLAELEALRPGGEWNSMIWVTDDDISWWPISPTLERIRKQYAEE